MRHSWAILNMVLKVSIPSFLKVSIPSFDSMSSTKFSKLVRSLSANSASFSAMSLWPLNGIFWSTQFHSIHNGSDSPTGFLNASLFFSIFSLVLNETLSFLESLYLCTIVSFKGGSSLFLNLLQFNAVKSPYSLKLHASSGISSVKP